MQSLEDPPVVRYATPSWVGLPPWVSIRSTSWALTAPVWMDPAGRPQQIGPVRADPTEVDPTAGRGGERR